MGNEHHDQERRETSDELLAHYKPIAIKAVLAGCAVQSVSGKAERTALIQGERLPEGFHAPIDLND